MSLLLLLRPGGGTEAPEPAGGGGVIAAPRRYVEPLPAYPAWIAASLAGRGHLRGTITYITRPDDDEAVIAAAWLILEAARQQET